MATRKRRRSKHQRLDMEEIAAYMAGMVENFNELEVSYIDDEGVYVDNHRTDAHMMFYLRLGEIRIRVTRGRSNHGASGEVIARVEMNASSLVDTFSYSDDLSHTIADFLVKGYVNLLVPYRKTHTDLTREEARKLRHMSRR